MKIGLAGGKFGFVFADAKAGSSIAARIAMMAMTTNSSIKVKALGLAFLIGI